MPLRAAKKGPRFRRAQLFTGADAEQAALFDVMHRQYEASLLGIGYRHEDHRRYA
jgi:hypothetical protein